MANSEYYYRCAECRQPCDTVELDFGIGAYEYWGATGVDVNLQTVSTCCEGDLWTPEQYADVLAEEAPDE